MSNPSLILPQSPAYGEDYVYAAQVEDGAVPLYNVLPLTFTRASGGTRINKDGLVQNMPYNLLQYSQEIGNGIAWQSLNAIVITPNSTTAPDGTMTADTLLDVGGASIVRQFDYSVVAGQTYTFSVYLKKATGSPLTRLRIEQDQSPYNNTYIDITPTNEWVRYSVTRTIEAGITSVNYGIFPDINNGDSVYAWGAQVNIGSTAQPYLATTDRLNMPRITYPVGGGCGALLLEKQSTNLVYPSEDFSAWSLFNSATVSTNTTISPDGTQNADTLNFASSAISQVFSNQGDGTNTAHTVSIYAKSSSGKKFRIKIANSATGGDEFSSNLTTTSDWQRFDFTFTCPITHIAICNESAGGTGTIQIWGAQLEASSYATSYIPTTSTSATRIADACYKTGISNLIGQTEGVVFCDFVWQGLGTANVDNAIFSIGEQSYGTSNIAISNYNGALYGRVTNGVSVDATVAFGSMTIGTRYKCAIGYANNDFVFYVNGTNCGNDTSVSIPALSDAYFQNSYPNSKQVNQAILYKTRLTNAELATLTTI